MKPSRAIIYNPPNPKYCEKCSRTGEAKAKMTLFAGGIYRCGRCWFLAQRFRIEDRTDYRKITGKKTKYASSIRDLKRSIKNIER